MSIVASSPSLTNTLSVVSRHAVDTVAVTGVIIEAGRLYVSLIGTKRKYFLEVKAKTLLSFSLFRDFILQEEGELISHLSQRAPSERRRNYEWQTALEVAYGRGRGQ